MKISVLALFWCIGLASAHAQSDIAIQNFKSATQIIPPAPGAAALAKFAEMPVNGHTGVPQIEVPIFDWKSKRGNSSLMVSLAYHAGGIKVEDVAACTGLGWALTAEGNVTRSVRGLPDDNGFGYINTGVLPNYNTSAYDGSYYLNPYVYAEELFTMDTSRLKIIGPFNHLNQPNSIEVLLGQIDTEQDFFYYSVGGYSGKFVLNKDGEVTKIDENDLIITVQYAPNLSYKLIRSFEIQANHGVKYILDVNESSEAASIGSTNSYNYGLSGYPVSSSVHSPQTSIYTSTFKISKAIDLNSRDTIVYTYTSGTNQYFGGWNESLEFHDNHDPLLVLEGIQTQNKIRSQSASFTFNSINIQRLKKIHLPDSTTVEFFYDQSRIDLSSDFALNRIEVKDFLLNTQRFQLSYDYFNSDYALFPDETAPYAHPANSNAPYVFSLDHFYKRLKLVKIEQVVNWGAGERVLYREFSYNATSLPPRCSKAIDFWGYYYGPVRKAFTLIPAKEPALIEPLVTEGVQPSLGATAWMFNAFSEGADRTPDSIFCKAGVLSKIILPTGGHTAFDFEPNRINGSLYFNSAYRSTGFKSQASGHFSSALTDLLLPGRTNQQVLFFVNIMRVNQDGSPYLQPANNGEPMSCFEDAVANSTINFTVASTDNTVTKTCGINAVQQGESVSKIYFSLPVGKQYKFQYAYNTSSDPCLHNVFFNIETSTKFLVDASSSLAGGLRAKNIRYFEPVGNTEIVKTYSYNDFSGNSTGFVPALPSSEQNVHATGKWFVFPESGGIDYVFEGYAKFKVRTSNSTQSLGYSQGGNVGYTVVSQKSVDQQGTPLGKTESYFSGLEQRNVYTTYPYKPSQLIDWASGKLIREIKYSRDGNRVSELENTYVNTISEQLNDKNRSLKVGQIRTDDAAGQNQAYFGRFVASAYYPFFGKSLLAKNVQKVYANNQVLSTTTLFAYSGQRLKSKLTQYSTNTLENEKTEYYYPDEFTNLAMQKLVSNHLKGIPVASRTTRYKSLVNQPLREVAGEGVDYTILTGFAKPYLYSKHASINPQTNTAFNPAMAKRLTDEITGEITKYDDAGNVCEFRGADGVINSIVWGYGYRLPIIQVVGATYQETLSKINSVTPSSLQQVVDPVVLRAIFLEARNGFLSTTSKVLISGATYAPLIGITSQTDPNGRTTYYEYDAFNRLKRIKDHDGNTVKVMDYQYQKPITQ